MNVTRKTRDIAASALRCLPGAHRMVARWRRSQYDRQVAGFGKARDGRAPRLPRGIVYEATMRCNLRCGFCYVGGLLNAEGEWRQELSPEAVQRAFPDGHGVEISLTGGETFMRRDIGDVLEVFRAKGYVCRYLTTNATLLDDQRATALAGLARDGFLKHISVSIDGPGHLHDAARGVAGTFERTAAGLRRLQDATRAAGSTLRVSINTTVSTESLAMLDRMADVADELGVDAIGVNHLMFATPDEVADTARILGTSDTTCITTFVTADPAIAPADVRTKLAALAARCRERGIRFNARPRVHPGIIERYYTPNAELEGRCLYPFLHARVGFSGKVYFCPFIRMEVGDLSQQPLENIWNGDRYLQLRQTLVEQRLFPVCRRCCKVELERAC